MRWQISLGPRIVMSVITPLVRQTHASVARKCCLSLCLVVVEPGKQLPPKLLPTTRERETSCDQSPFHRAMLLADPERRSYVVLPSMQNVWSRRSTQGTPGSRLTSTSSQNATSVHPSRCPKVLGNPHISRERPIGDPPKTDLRSFVKSGLSLQVTQMQCTQAEVV